MKLLLLLLVFICSSVKADEKLSIHIRYNPGSPPVTDVVTFHLLHAPVYGSIVTTSNEIASLSISVDSLTVPNLLVFQVRDWINSLGISRLACKRIKNDVFVIQSSFPVKLAISSGDSDPGNGLAYLINFGDGVSNVADGIVNNNAGTECDNNNDFSVFPYSGGGLCFIEHLDSSLLGEGNGGGMVLDSSVDVFPYDTIDKAVAPNTSLRLRVRGVLAPRLIGMPFIVMVSPGFWYTSSFLSVNFFGTTEYDLVGVNEGAFPLIGIPGSLFGGYPTVSYFGWVFPIPWTALSVYSGLSLTFQAFVFDDTRVNGITVTNSIEHQIL